MKKKYLFIALFSLVTANSYAAVCEDHLVSLRCGPGTVQDIHYLGEVDLSGTTVLNNFSVRGNVNVKNAQLKDVDVRGGGDFNGTAITGNMKTLGNLTVQEGTIASDVDIVGNFYGRNTRFNGNTHIVGLVKCDSCTFVNNNFFVGDIVATDTYFTSGITLNAKSSVFIHSMLLDINVKRPSDNEEQTITLNNHSEVRNIIFESGRGKVIIDRDSVITGQVQGGNVVKQ